MKILLTEPPRKQSFYDLSHANLGILYLASYLRDKYDEDDLQIRYLEGDHSLMSHLTEIGRFCPDIYCLSFSYPIAPLAYQTIDAVKKTYPKLPVICGGPHPTSSAQDVLEKTRANICVLGEGEETLLDLVKYYAGEGTVHLSDIDGIAFKENGDRIHFTAPRRYIYDLDTIPFPAWDLVPVDKYEGMHFRKAFPYAYVAASRGCPFNCVFCSNPVWKLQKPWLRMRSPSDVAGEIEFLYQRGVREVWFTSDEMNPNLQWAIEVCRAVTQLEHRDMFFQMQLRVDKVTEEFVQVLKEMNCWMVHLGVESLNQRVLDGIEKRFAIKQVMKALDLFHAYGIKVDFYMMAYQVWEENGKLCWETPEEVAHSLRKCWKLFLRNRIHYMSWQAASPFPGSRLYDIAKRHNILDSKIPDSFWEMYMSLPGISRRQINSHIRKGILLKDFMALISGNLSLRALWRLRRNIIAIAKTFTG